MDIYIKSKNLKTKNMSDPTIGSGKIKVLAKISEDNYVNILCNSVELYGENYSFSDSYQELVELDGKILSIPFKQVIQIKAV